MSRSNSALVLTLAVTEDGTILASGGSQGTRLWDVAHMSEIERPSGSGVRGATLVVIWARQTEEAHDVLYAGTQNGFFYCWRKKDGIFEETFVIQTPDIGEITAMAFDSTNNRLCLCTLQRHSPILGNFQGRIDWEVDADEPIAFAAFDNSQDRDIIVLGLHNNGPIYTLRGRTGEIASHWSVGARIGDAAFNWRDGVVCLEDPDSGPALFRLSDQVKSRAYGIERDRAVVRPRKVCFGEQGTTVVCGSDHGCVYVFDTRSGQKLATLSVGSAEWVQVVTTAEIDDVSVIAAQMRAMDCSEEILVWKRAQPVAEKKSHRNMVAWFFKALVVLGCLAFVYQNVEPILKGIRKDLPETGTNAQEDA
ncbi:quinon protein alcohol dehydrogenase-like superfamily [Mycena metata]|uniref:Quinon protein alcohol dehydrogenase-like superfamily n=1 Tax=Mycena metata TaxID=1033252 RepID=A0AAD7IYA7_9AGAR|nr:quinon protein alcohol dehydrogenase-like superfamily [Mycena metata]